VDVALTSDGPRRLRATITAGTAGGAATNRLQTLQFTRLTGATVDIGNLTNQAVPFTFAAGGATSVTLFVNQLQPGTAGTAEVTVVDGCGSWPTFVGAGPNGF
jgi:hypothetical protein